MKIKIFIALFFAGFFNSLNAFKSSNTFDNAHVDFYSIIQEYKGIKKITKRTFSNWEVISCFNKEGYLLGQTNAYNNEIRSDFRYNYTVTDTLAEVRRLNKIDINRRGDTLRIERYYYDSSSQCYQFRLSSTDRDTSRYSSTDNFVYEDGMLISYTRGSSKNTCKYNEKKQLVYRLEISGYSDTTFYTYIYNHYGQLTDFIKESPDITVFYSGAPRWNSTRGNKIHIRFVDFDRYGNWTKSYFITENEEVFNEERKIEYWQSNLSKQELNTIEWKYELKQKCRTPNERFGTMAGVARRKFGAILEFCLPREPQ